jgi:hypothetical protein
LSTSVKHTTVMALAVSAIAVLPAGLIPTPAAAAQLVAAGFRVDGPLGHVPTR